MKPINPKIVGKDIPIDKLVPSKIRTIPNRDMKRLRASIQSVGIIEPIIVYRDTEDYKILDGYGRYTILKEMGCQTVPCIVVDTRDMLSPHKFVCHISNTEESKMIQEARKVLSDKEIASALGLQKISHRINSHLLSQLHPSVKAAFNSGKLNKACAKILSYVIPERQAEIFKIMKNVGNFGVEMARQHVLKTPVKQRLVVSGKTPWSKNSERKHTLVDKLERASKDQDFTRTVFQQLSFDLVRFIAHLRKVIAHQELGDYIREHFPSQLTLIQEIIRDETGEAIDDDYPELSRRISIKMKKAS